MNFLMCAVLAATTVFRLELTDEKPYIVGVDGVRREVVLVSPEEYCALTNNVIKTWKKLHDTEEGRRKIHGKRINQTFKDKKRIDTYEDGFKFPFPMSKRHQEVYRKRKEIMSGKVKEITVEHDAATGKDIVK